MAQIGQAQDIEETLKERLRLTDSKVQVQSVIDGETLMINNDRIIYLPAIHIPMETPQSQGDYGVTAKDFLEENLKGKFIRIYQVRNNERALQNALGHEAAYIVRVDDGWFAQGELAKNGIAFAYPTQSHFAMADILYEAEALARENNAGLWAEEKWQIHNPQTIKNIENQFVIVEGNVRKVASRNNVIYINFEDDWKKDFTVAADSSLRRDFSKAGIDVMNLGGQTIRARGWVRDYNGPYMEIFHPSQIEIVKDER